MDITVGALDANAALILRVAREAVRRGAQVVAFPELALSGYPPEDLVLKAHFVTDCRSRLERLAAEAPREAVLLVGTPWRDDGGVFNAAAVVHGGRVACVYRKMLLPNYGVFDEKRVFAAGDRALVLEIAGRRVGLHICEDSWFADAPSMRRLMAGPGLDALINLSASPYHRGKLGRREEVLGQAARTLRTHVVYVNLVGGQDELVFDGASMVLDPAGRLLARAASFREDVLLAGLPPPSPRAESVAGPDPERCELPLAPAPRSGAEPPRVEPALEDQAEVYAALQLGLRDYVAKNNFRRTVVAVSGGIDSALVAAIAVDALDRDRVVAVTMPSRFSSPGTRNDAAQLAQNLGIELRTVPIDRLQDAYLRELQPLWPDRPPDVTEENLQARIRGNIVMALSNKFGWLVLTTGNKSELATGYCTLYGDMAGGLAVIKDVPKTLVFELARWRNRQGPAPVIPPSTIERPPSAELRDNQRDTDSLPSYDVLDAILALYVEGDRPLEDIIAQGFDAATVRRVAGLVDGSEYKRRQGAPGLKITPKAFGRDRRMPITNGYRN